MNIDFSTEHSITLSQVPIHVPKRGGKKVHSSTVYRWATKGARGRVLESVMVGGIRYTTVEAVRRFLTANSRSTTMARPNSHNELDEAIEDALRQAGV